MEKIETYNQLKTAYYNKHPHGHFFDYATLKWFGERESDMRLLKSKAKIKAWDGEHICYVLSSYQRKHPLGARRVHHYFDIETLEDIQAI